MSTPKILQIIDSLPLGGAEKLMAGIVNGMKDCEHHVIYLGGPETIKSWLPANCRIVKLNYRSKLDLFSCIIKLRRYIRRHNIDVVHSHLFLSTIIARLACPRNVRLFTTIHSLPSKNYFAQGWLNKLLEKLTYRPHHYMIAICKEVLADYNRCIGIKGPYTILYNYVEDKFFAGQYKKTEVNQQLKLVAVGNLRKPKNYPFLVQAFRQLPDAVSLDIYGVGPLQEQLQNDIDRYSLNIRLCGQREDIQHILPRYDAFIMSSLYEGQPVSLLEAMAVGIPVILSDIPVLREVTDNNAVFFNLNNTDDLVSKINRILSHDIDMDGFTHSNFKRVRLIADKSNYINTLRRMYVSPGDVYFRMPLAPVPKVSLPSMAK